MPSLGKLWLLTSLMTFLCLGCAESPSYRGEAIADPKPAPSLQGTNWDGEPYELANQQGKVAVVFFGYTFCPDVCPLALAKLKKVARDLGDHARDLEVVFVSVDPHRDTVEKLAAYVPNFNPDFVGLHLDFDAMTRMSEAWDITVQYGQPKDGPGSNSFYYVDHTGSYFLINQKGELVIKHPPNASSDDLLADVHALIKE